MAKTKTVDRSSYNIPVYPRPSHIDTLPNELLVEIFKLGCSTHRRYIEVLYSHVSRRWRYVATNLPTLWTTIYVIAHSSLFWLPHYLSRSQSCHIDICIDHWGLDLGKGCGAEDRKNKIADIMNLLIPHTNRWSRLHVQGVFDASAYLVLSHLDNLSAPVLRELIVEFDTRVEEEWTEENSVPFNILQGGAPFLTSIQLHMLQRCWPPVSALTTCTIYLFHCSAACMRFIQLLASSHALTKLRVHGYDGSNEFAEFDSPSRIQLDTLKSLWLDATFHYGLFSLLLKAISVPRLETLELEEVTDSTLRRLFDSSWRSLVNFPALRTLSLNSVELDDNSCIQLPRMFPSITRLQVRSVLPNDLQRLPQLLSAPSQLYGTEARDTSDGGSVPAGIIWPKLHTIVLGRLLEPDPLIQYDDVLCDMLAARRQIGRPIERLVLGNVLLGKVDGSDRLRGYLELWEHPYASDDES